MANFTNEKKVLQELVKARNAVKRKYNLIKFQKDDTNRILNETFKPIIDPLQTLVEHKKHKKHIKKKKKEELEEKDYGLEEDDMEEEEDEDEKDALDESMNFQTVDDSTINDFYPNKSLANDSFDKIEKTIVVKRREEDLEIPVLDQDKIYGIKATSDGYKIGNVPIQFEKVSIIVKKKSFSRTSGLYELLIHKNPQNYTPTDLKPYKEILEISNVHRKNFKQNAQIKKHTMSKKYNHIIAPLFAIDSLNSTPKRISPSKAYKKAQISRKNPMSTPKEKLGNGVIPRFKIARRDMRMDYIYYDDPNEIVERLQLLIAEQAAGNLSHTNEIHSIIEELREGGYIY